MRRIGIVSVLLLTAVLAGCSDNPQKDAEGFAYKSERNIRLEDGRMIHCLALSNGSGYNGISCDWANAK